jgi:hypothetical protein
LPTTKPRDFAAKLRLVARLLGCRTRKEFCTRFRDADPATAFRPDRVAKWMQGTAAPREGRAYAEVARLLGLDRSATWIAECPLAEFEAVARRARAAQPPASPPAAATAPGDNSHLYGTYHCFSPAWSSYYPGQLIRGRLTLSAEPGGGLHADYVEVIAGKPTLFRGQAAVTPRGLQMLLREGQAGIGLVLTTYLPAHPSSVLCGMLSGATLLGPDLAPAACRFVALRVPGAPADPPSGYMEPLPEQVTADLRALGLAAMPELGQAVIGFLVGGDRAPADHVAWADQERLTRLADRLHLPEPDAPRAAAAAEGAPATSAA